jgi:DNA-binding PadR family transcriptional regulator
MSVRTLTDAEFAILSLLGESNRYGYEIESLIEARGMREWTEIGFSSIYFLLDKLHKRGLARPLEARRKPRAAKSFTITQEGRKCLFATTAEMLAEPNRLYPGVLLGMANWPVLDEALGLSALAQRSSRLLAEIARLEDVRRGQRPLPEFVECLFDYTIGQLEADRAWTDRTIQKLEGREVEKIDFKKKLGSLYRAPAGKFVSVDVPVMQFIKIDGQGDPNVDPSYKHAIEWLYSVSYAIKFAAKTTYKKDYVVPPLEGLWWADDPDDFVKRRKDRWRWTMMIMVPDFVEAAVFDAAVTKARKKRGAT